MRVDIHTMNPIEDFLRKFEMLELSNVRGYTRMVNGKLVNVKSFNRLDPKTVATVLAPQTGHLNDQQLQMAIDHLHLHFDNLASTQQTAARALLNHLEQAKNTRAAGASNLRHNIDPLRSDDEKFDWNNFRKGLRRITG